MNNVYFFQVADAFRSRTNQMYLPYAVGTLAAKAWSNPEIAKRWTIQKIFCKREPPETIVRAMVQPTIAAFSNYIWNYEFNLYTARLVKERFPDCTVIFGGHHISAHGNILENNPAVDVLIFGEGEEIFEQILLSFSAGTPLDDVPNIAFRRADGIVRLPVPVYDGDFRRDSARKPEHELFGDSGNEPRLSLPLRVLRLGTIKNEGAHVSA